MPLQSGCIALYLFHSRGENINLRGDLVKISDFCTVVTTPQNFYCTIKKFLSGYMGQITFHRLFVQSLKQAVKVNMLVFLYLRVSVALWILIAPIPFWEQSKEKLWY